jgi:GNAT superfamily N-acetyltransferase
MFIKNGDVDHAIIIMREAAEWLISSGKLLWKIEDLTKEKILNGITEENVYVGWKNNLPIAAMILQWHDPFFWKNVKPFESGFIHKLSVKREYAGKGYSKEMVKFAESECKKRGIFLLRLDCAGDRPKLCNFYESLGFVQINRKMMGIFDMAFYEKKL